MNNNASRFQLSSIQSHTGAHLPPRDTIRALVVYVQLPDDKLPDEFWERGKIPLWSSTYNQKLQNYFHEMSWGKLHFILETHPREIILPKTDQQYIDDKENYGDASKYIISTLDKEYDFSRFDIWNAQDHEFSVYKEPDGRVDLMIVIYRHVGWNTFLPFSGVSDLGFEGYVFVDSMQRFFFGGNGHFSDAGSSGVTLCNRSYTTSVTDLNYAFGVSAHEIMHKIYGEGHPARLFGGLGLMGSSGAGMGLNSLERHILGMITFKEIPYGVDTTITLHDYMTTGDAVLLPIPQRLDLFYSFEYRKKISQYDTAPIEGVYIYRIDNSGNWNQKEIVVQSADGKWQWMYDSTRTHVLKKYPDMLTGYNKLQAIPMNGKNMYADGWWGDRYDAFTMTNRYFSWWRNPSPDCIMGVDTIKTQLNCSVISMNDSIAKISIRYGNASILDVQPLRDNTFSLDQNYPNPVLKGSTTFIQFTLQKTSRVHLNLYNLIGKKIQTVYEGTGETGLNTIQFQTASLLTGTYMYELIVAGKRYQRLMQIVN